MAGQDKIFGGVLEQLTELEREVATLIAEAVNLEKPVVELDPNIPLFGDGLGLDSIDVLEIALAVSKKYGFQLRSDDPGNSRIFASLRSLAVHIAQHRTR
jgi:acyl carrier protein